MQSEEHIYETIAECADEPIYSTPYEQEAMRPMLNNSPSLGQMSNRSDRKSAHSLPNNNNKRNGIQRMDKTQDVEHWIRHATVVNPSSAADAKKRTESSTIG